MPSYGSGPYGAGPFGVGAGVGAGGGGAGYTAILDAVANTKYAVRLTMPQSAAVAKVSFYLDGLGAAGTGPQVARALLYNSLDALLASSEEVSVQRGQAAGWVDFRFPSFGGKLVLSPGDFLVAIHVGNFPGTIRLYGNDPAGAGGKSNADTYSDGASVAFGAATPTTLQLGAWVTTFTPYHAPSEEDLYYSRLPYQQAQNVLGAAGPTGVARLADVGWHDTFIDPEEGAVALVRDGGALADLLGERIRVTTQGVALPRSVVAFVHNVADADAFDWDLSLARHLYAQLGLLAAETLPTLVQVLD